MVFFIRKKKGKLVSKSLFLNDKDGHFGLKNNQNAQKTKNFKKANFVCLLRKSKKNFASGIAKRSYTHLKKKKKEQIRKKPSFLSLFLKN